METVNELMEVRLETRGAVGSRGKEVVVDSAMLGDSMVLLEPKSGVVIGAAILDAEVLSRSTVDNTNDVLVEETMPPRSEPYLNAKITLGLKMALPITISLFW